MPKIKKPRPQGHATPPQVVVLDDYGYPVDPRTTPEQLVQINLMRKRNDEFAKWRTAKGIPPNEDGHLATFMAERPDLYPPGHSFLGV